MIYEIEISCCTLAAGGPAAEGEGGASRMTLRFLRVETCGDTWQPGELRSGEHGGSGE